MAADDRYRKVSDDTGQSFYCPLAAVASDNRLKADRRDDCIETEVVHRYSGQIRVVRS